jgi:hypothetical protein
MRIRLREGKTERHSPQVPLGFALAAGFATSVVGCLLASLAAPPRETAARLVAVALIVTGFAAAIRNLPAAVLTAGMAWSIYLGFLVGRAGELHWHGGVDALRLGTLIVAALAGSARWWITDFVSDWSGSSRAPLSREEPSPAVIPRPLDAPDARSTFTPVGNSRPQADQGNRRNG